MRTPKESSLWFVLLAMLALAGIVVSSMAGNVAVFEDKPFPKPSTATISSGVFAASGATLTSLTVTGEASLTSLSLSGDSGMTSLTVSGEANITSLTATGSTNIADLTAAEMEASDASATSLTVTGEATITSQTAATFSTSDASATSLTVTGEANLTSLTAIGLYSEQTTSTRVDSDLTSTSELYVSGEATITTGSISGYLYPLNDPISGITSAGISLPLAEFTSMTISGEAYITSLTVGSFTSATVSELVTTSTVGSDAEFTSLTVTGEANLTSLTATNFTAGGGNPDFDRIGIGLDRAPNYMIEASGVSNADCELRFSRAPSASTGGSYVSLWNDTTNTNWTGQAISEGYFRFLARDSAGSVITIGRMQGDVTDRTAGQMDSRLYFYTMKDGSSAYRMTIWRDYIGIGTINPTCRLDVSGETKTTDLTVTGNANLANLTVDGVVMAPSFETTGGFSVSAEGIVSGIEEVQATSTTLTGEAKLTSLTALGNSVFYGFNNFGGASITGNLSMGWSLPGEEDYEAGVILVDTLQSYSSAYGMDYPVTIDDSLVVDGDVEAGDLDLSGEAEVTSLTVTGEIFVTSGSIVVDEFVATRISASDTWDNLLIRADGDPYTVENWVSYCTAVGVHAGRQMFDGSSGSSISAFGFCAGANLKESDFNVAVGALALGSQNYASFACTGSRNVAVGSRSMTEATGSSSGNVVVGYYSLSEANGANYNSCLGYESGKYITSGDSNVLIGKSSGDSITTGSNNIVIGSSADTPEVTSSYCLNIGNTIYGLLNLDRVGIGVETPTEALDVNGNVKATTFIGDVSDADGLRWHTVAASSFTGAPASTSQLSMSNTSSIKKALPLRYTIGGTAYYGVVANVSENASLTVTGAPLSGTVTSLAVGDPEMVVPMNFFVEGFYEDATDSSLLEHDTRYFCYWQQGAAKLVAVRAVHIANDSSANPSVEITVGGVSGVVSQVAETTFPDISSPVVSVDVSKYAVNPGDRIEVRATKTGTGDAENLSITGIFVLE